MHDLIIVYSTLGSFKEAKKISKILIINQLSCCVNIVKNVTSFFTWENEIKESKEVILITKTRKSLFEELKTTIMENSSYECPCIVSVEITDGNRNYLNWTHEHLK